MFPKEQPFTVHFELPRDNDLDQLTGLCPQANEAANNDDRGAMSNYTDYAYDDAGANLTSPDVGRCAVALPADAGNATNATLAEPIPCWQEQCLGRSL